MHYSTNHLCTPPSTPLIYSLSLHDALPISLHIATPRPRRRVRDRASPNEPNSGAAIMYTIMKPVMSDPSCVSESRDRKSTRLNSSHTVISYAVFCLKKKKY